MNSSPNWSKRSKPPRRSRKISTSYGGIDLVVDRFVAGASAVGHAVGLHSPEFWPNWRQFVDRNVAIEAESRGGNLPIELVSGRRKHGLPVAAPSNLQSSDAAKDPKSAVAEVLRGSRRRPEYDDGTTIRLIRTYGGEERVDVEYSGRKPEAIVADTTSNADENSRELHENAPAMKPTPTGHERLADAILRIPRVWGVRSASLRK